MNMCHENMPEMLSQCLQFRDSDKVLDILKAFICVITKRECRKDFLAAAEVWCFLFTDTQLELDLMYTVKRYIYLT